MSIQRYRELIAAGYKPEQILTCPLGEIPAPVRLTGRSEIARWRVPRPLRARENINHET